MYHLSTKQRYRIVEEYERVGTISQTSRNLKLRPGTCRLWVNRYLETGGVEDKPGRGRKPILSEVDAKLALDLLVSNAHEGPSDVAKMLVQKGASQVLVHRCTIQRAGRRAALQEGKVMRAFRGKPHCKFLGQRVVDQRLTPSRLSLCSALYCWILFSTCAGSSTTFNEGLLWAFPNTGGLSNTFSTSLKLYAALFSSAWQQSRDSLRQKSRRWSRPRGRSSPASAGTLQQSVSSR